MTSIRWYGVGALLVVAGFAAGFGWWGRAMLQLTDVRESFQPVGRGRVVLVDEPGPHTVWAERPCAGFCALEPADVYRRHLRVSFTRAGEDAGDRPATVPVEPHPHGGRYNVGQARDGRAVWLVTFPAAGEYVADVRSDATIISPELWLGDEARLPVRPLVPAIQLAAAGTIAGLVVTVLTYRARQRSADRFAERLDSFRVGKPRHHRDDPTENGRGEGDSSEI